MHLAKYNYNDEINSNRSRIIKNQINVSLQKIYSYTNRLLCVIIIELSSLPIA